MSTKQTPHTVKRFDQELGLIHRLVGEMGQLVVSQIDRAETTLRACDLAEATELVARDAAINALDVRIDEELVKLMVRRQPMANDLRDVMTVAKLVSDLERIGDEVRKVGVLVQRLCGNHERPPRDEMLVDLFRLLDLGREMTVAVLDAFEQIDLAAALAVIAQDRTIEAAFQHALRQLASFVAEDPRTIGQSIEITLCLRALERVGGHAKNIAGYLVYLATGTDVRHASTNEIAALIPRAGSQD